MYDNIGGKIKGLAKTMFIVEAIGAVIMGIALLTTDDDFILAGLLTLFCGPIIAWVSSWILYAFGELVEDIHAMRNKYYPIAEEQANRETEEKAKHEAESEENPCVIEKTLNQENLIEYETIQTIPDSESMYKYAYNKHYYQKDYTNAIVAYLNILYAFPKSKESGYSKSQINNLKNTVNIDDFDISQQLKDIYIKYTTTAE